MMTEQTYFAKDGSYGSGVDLLLIDTSKWTAEMWEALEEAGDENRIVVAHRFHHGYNVEDVQELLT